MEGRRSLWRHGLNIEGLNWNLFGDKGFIEASYIYSLTNFFRVMGLQSVE